MDSQESSLPRIHPCLLAQPLRIWTTRKGLVNYQCLKIYHLSRKPRRFQQGWHCSGTGNCTIPFPRCRLPTDPAVQRIKALNHVKVEMETLSQQGYSLVQGRRAVKGLRRWINSLKAGSRQNRNLLEVTIRLHILLYWPRTEVPVLTIKRY